MVFKNSYELGRHVQFCHAKTLEESVTAALEFESFSSRRIGQIPTVKKPLTSKPEVSSFVQAISNDSIRTVVKGESGSDLASLILGEFQKLNRKLNSMNRNHKARNSKRLSQRQCYICGEFGHVSYECSFKQGAKTL